MSPRKNRHRRDEIETLEELRAHLDLGQGLAGLVVQALDVGAAPALERVDVTGTIFLGCTFRDRAQELALVQRGAAVFPAFTGLPYEPYRGTLYTVDELLDGFYELLPGNPSSPAPHTRTTTRSSGVAGR